MTAKPQRGGNTPGENTVPGTDRWIAHIDMDAFFVSVERLIDPSLKNRPVVVGGDPHSRGVVASASYEARRCGVHSAMPSRRARELCPEAVFVSGHHHLYSSYHRQVRKILERYTPVLQTASIDEFYLDFTGCTLLHGAILPLLGDIREQIGAELDLPASAGLASNKLLAKIASALAKPAGILWIPAGTEADFLAPLPIRTLPGVGPATERELTRLGIRRIGHLATFPEQVLKGALGKWGTELARKSRGISLSPVESKGPRKSVGHETTFKEDIADPELLQAALCRLVERAAWRLRSSHFRAGGVTVKVRYSDFRTITRSRKIPPTDGDREILQAAKELLTRAVSRRVRVRLLGVSLDRLAGKEEQLGLFSPEGLRRRSLLLPAVDRIRDRFGFDAITLAAGAGRGRRGGGPSTSS